MPKDTFLVNYQSGNLSPELLWLAVAQYLGKVACYCRRRPSPPPLSRCYDSERGGHLVDSVPPKRISQHSHMIEQASTRACFRLLGWARPGSLALIRLQSTWHGSDRPVSALQLLLLLHEIPVPCFPASLHYSIPGCLWWIDRRLPRSQTSTRRKQCGNTSRKAQL